MHNKGRRPIVRAKDGLQHAVVRDLHKKLLLPSATSIAAPLLTTMRAVPYDYDCRGPLGKGIPVDYGAAIASASSSRHAKMLLMIAARLSAGDS